jgi:DNA invertase Pin-like site-specific DNA recombinase
VSNERKALRAAIYTRISLDRAGQSLGVTRQRDDCRALADKLGWSVVAEFDDNDRSATSGKPRPGFEALLDGMAAGDFDAVLAWHPDRLYRKLADLSRLLDVARGIEFRTVTAGQLDLSTPSGRMMAGILGSVSTAEVEHKSERQRRAARQLAESGAPKWRRAFGYLDAGGDRREVDPATAPLVKQAYADILAGASLNDVCKAWTAAGATTLNGKRWTAPQLSTFLRKPRNAGLRTYQAERGAVDRDTVLGKGNWPALVDEDTFWAVQAVIDNPDRRPGPRTVRRYLLTGVLLCGKCNGQYRLSGLWGKGAHDIVYVCKQCRGVSIRAQHVEPQLVGLIGGRLAQPDAVDLLRAEEHDTAEAEALRVESNTLLARLDQIADERADGQLTGRQAQRATERVQARLDAIESRQKDQTRVRVLDGIPVGRPEAADAVKRLSPDRFRAVLDLLATVTVTPVGKGGHTYRPDRVQIHWHDV